MKVFISSVITGFEEFRDDAADAIRSLDHEPKRAEDYTAAPGSPEQVCLAGVRDADAVVIIMGQRYGQPQPSGLSATHEEYREARDEGKDVLAFVQKGVHPEHAQGEFIAEVQEWAEGQYTGSFSTGADLRTAVTRALHRLEQARAAGQADPQELLARAQAAIPQRAQFQATCLYVAVAAGPTRHVLSPQELENETFHRRLIHLATDASLRVFDFRQASRLSIRDDALVIDQEDASVGIDELGTATVRQRAQAQNNRPLGGGLDSLVLIHEYVQERIEHALGFIERVLEEIDRPRRLTDVAVQVSILGANYQAWRTQSEHQQSPSTATPTLTGRPLVATLTPPLRKRAALRTEPAKLASELAARLRRQARR